MRGFNIERLVFISFLLLLFFCAFADFYFTRSTPVNSDNVASFNELRAVYNSNFLLHGWCLATDNFYFTDLPFYVIFAAFFGEQPWLIFVVPYFVFLLFLVSCLIIVIQSSRSPMSRYFGCFTVLILLGLPYTFTQDILLKSAIHGGTIMMSTYGFAVGQRILSNPRFNSLLLAPFCAIVFAVTASDPQADAYFVVPFIVLFFVRYWLYSATSRGEVLLLLSLVIFGLLGSIFPYFLSRNGGFELETNYSLGFVPSIPYAILNAIAFINAFVMSFDARSIVMPDIWGRSLIASSRLFTCLIVIFLCLSVFLQMLRARHMVFLQWLMMSVLMLAAADITSAIFAARVADSAFMFPVIAVRYVTPAYIYASLCAIVAAQQIFVTNPRSKSFFIGVGAALYLVYLIGAVQVLYRTINQPAYIYTMPQRVLVDWLAAHNLTYGVGDYWTSQVVTALSSNKIIVDEVIAHDTVVPYRWVGNMTDLDAKKSPEFVVFTPVNKNFVPTDQNITIENVTQTYGKPSQIFNVNGFIVAELIKK